MNGQRTVRLSITETMNELSAKTDIISAIRKNLSASRPLDSAHSASESHSSIESPDLISSSTVQPQENLSDTFRDNLIAVGGRFATVSGSENVAVALQSILDELGARRVAVSDSEAVRSAIAQVITKAQILQNAPAPELFECDVGITEAQYGIAETGTLVLDGDKEASRLTSLVPEAHICILQAGNLRATMSSILQILQERVSPLVTFITGPSRTSDIELTLALGIHGPRALYVIVIDDA